MACNNEGHLVHGVEGGGDVCTLAVAATDRVPGDYRRGYCNKIKKATKPGGGEADPHLGLRDVNVEGNLSEHQKTNY